MFDIITYKGTPIVPILLAIFYLVTLVLQLVLFASRRKWVRRIPSLCVLASTAIAILLLVLMLFNIQIVSDEGYPITMILVPAAVIPCILASAAAILTAYLLRAAVRRRVRRSRT